MMLDGTVGRVAGVTSSFAAARFFKKRATPLFLFRSFLKETSDPPFVFSRNERPLFLFRSFLFETSGEKGGFEKSFYSARFFLKRAGIRG